MSKGCRRLEQAWSSERRGRGDRPGRSSSCRSTPRPVTALTRPRLAGPTWRWESARLDQRLNGPGHMDHGLRSSTRGRHHVPGRPRRLSQSGNVVPHSGGSSSRRNRGRRALTACNRPRVLGTACVHARGKSTSAGGCHLPRRGRWRPSGRGGRGVTAVTGLFRGGFVGTRTGLVASEVRDPVLGREVLPAALFEVAAAHVLKRADRECTEPESARELRADFEVDVARDRHAAHHKHRLRRQMHALLQQRSRQTGGQDCQ